MHATTMAFRRGVGLAVVGAMLLLLAGASPAAAQVYLLKCHWNITMTEDETGPIPPENSVAHLDLTYIGGISFLFQGYVEIPGGSGLPVIGGTGIIKGSEFLLTTTTTQDHSGIPWRDSGVSHVRLDLTTFNGIFWAIRNDFNRSTRAFDTGYSAGTATFLGCP